MRVDLLSRDGPVGRAGPRVAAHLLEWYDAHARALPWRMPPGTNRADPYRVWLSEIMLQQTTVAAVTGYFARFTERWPSVEALAAAEPADVMAAWAGLGYYARARNLHACARIVARDHGGRFPEAEAALRALPGVGAYTAAAIAAIAFGQRAVAVDANVERVVSRLFAIDEPLPTARATIRAAADGIVPDARAGDFAQAMMDLGSAICTARAPRCGVCPLAGQCAASAAGDPGRYPIKPAKRPKPVRHGVAWWIERDGQVWLVRRPSRGLLGGMRALPTGPWGEALSRDPPFPADWLWSAESLTHVFTHFALRLHVASARIGAGPSPALQEAGEWWPIDSLGAAGLPTLFARAAQFAIGRDGRSGEAG